MTFEQIWAQRTSEDLVKEANERPTLRPQTAEFTVKGFRKRGIGSPTEDDDHKMAEQYPHATEFFLTPRAELDIGVRVNGVERRVDGVTISPVATRTRSGALASESRLWGQFEAIVTPKGEKYDSADDVLEAIVGNIFMGSWGETAIIQTEDGKQYKNLPRDEELYTEKRREYAEQGATFRNRLNRVWIPKDAD